jgi:hypothetical protein
MKVRAARGSMRVWRRKGIVWTSIFEERIVYRMKELLRWIDIESVKSKISRTLDLRFCQD